MESLEHRLVEFHGTSLSAIRDAHGTIWVPLRRLCEAIGLAYNSQYTKAREDRVLSRHIALVEVPDEFDRRQEMVCLDLAFVRGWLFGINASRVKPEIRERLERFQEQVYEVINQAFERVSAPRDGALSDEMISAIMENLQQQQQLWATVLQEKRRLRAVEDWVQDVDNRVGDLNRTVEGHAMLLSQTLETLQELRQSQQAITSSLTMTMPLLPSAGAPINPAQKAAIKALVDDIVAAAQAKGMRLGQGRNDYPAVWDAFKRRFDLAKYDELPGSQFDTAIQWLKEWRDRLG